MADFNITALINSLAIFQQRTTDDLEEGNNKFVSQAEKDKLNKIPFIFPESYGAVGDGVTDDSTAIQTAIDTGLPVYFSKKTYLIGTTINIPTNAQILGSGYDSVIKATTEIILFNIVGSDISIQNLSFLGNKIGAGQRGIAADGSGIGLDVYYNIKIDSCNFISLKNGVYSIRNMGTDYEGCFYISNSYFIDCTEGFWSNTRAEYNTLNNCIFKLCTTGVIFKGGNNSIVGGQIVSCTTGLSIVSGENDGHGVASAVKINHNTVNFLATSVSNNYLLNGCMFYAGKIQVNNSSGIRFESCEFGTWSLEVTDSSYTVFSNSFYQTNPTTITLTNNSNFINRGGVFKSESIPTELTNIDELKESTGSVIKFDASRKYGYPTSSTITTFTFDFSDAKEGYVPVIKSNVATEPTFPTVALITGDDFVPNVDNYYFLTPIKIDANTWQVHVNRVVYA